MGQTRNGRSPAIAFLRVATFALSFVIPPAPACRGRSRLAEASRGAKGHGKIAIDVRPGGPTAKRQPGPEGLGNRSRRGSERRRRGTKPIVRSPCVIRSDCLNVKRPAVHVSRLKPRFCYLSRPLDGCPMFGQA